MGKIEKLIVYKGFWMTSREAQKIEQEAKMEEEKTGLRNLQGHTLRKIVRYYFAHHKT